MTQTNNEREAFEKWYQSQFTGKVDFKRYSANSIYYDNDDIDTSWEALEARAQSPISQNEQQEVVTNLWEALGKWSAYLASNGEQANLAPPSWLIDAVSSATSPHKQSIPDGWKLVPIESDEQMKDEARAFLTGLELNVKTFESMSEHLRLSGAYLPDWFLNSKGHINKMAKAHYIYESMLNAAPTTSLTSETNTEVGND